MTNRSELGKWMEEKNMSTAIEVGVQAGVFSRDILSNWSGHLTMLDAWMQLGSEYIDIANISNEEQLLLKQTAIKNVEEFEGRYSIIQGVSPSIAESFEDHSFDLVYLDADHSKEACLRDIHAWIKKVKPGGVIGGHDYIDEVSCWGVFGVKSAVAEYFKKQPDIVTQESFPSWFIFV